MTLPPLPDSFFEDGLPLSQVAPGDTGRELIHEVKNLQQAILLLQKAMLPRSEADEREARLKQESLSYRRRVLKRIYGFGLTIALVLLIAAGYTLDTLNNQDKERYERCTGQALGAQNVQTYLEEQRAIAVDSNLPTDVLQRQIASLDRLGKSFPIPDCGDAP